MASDHCLAAASLSASARRCAVRELSPGRMMGATGSSAQVGAAIPRAATSANRIPTLGKRLAIEALRKKPRKGVGNLLRLGTEQHSHPRLLSLVFSITVPRSAAA